VLMCALPALACGPGNSRTPPGPGDTQEGAPVGRQLVTAVRVEPPSVATRVIGQPGISLTVARALFNAHVARIDGTGTPRPQLVEALPTLHSDAWQVFSDGRMETTYRLKPHLTWHDGTGLSSEDFVFSWRVYMTPEYGHFTSAPFQAIDDVVALDPLTFVIRWNRPYPEAGSLSMSKNELIPLPRHILEGPFAVLGADGFAGHPFWTREYVGLGPYQMERWEPGAFLEATAFAGYVSGRPKINRVKMLFINDSNTALANLLSGEIQVATDDSLGVHQVESLRREWGSLGVLYLAPGGSWRQTVFQLRPELASPGAILDVRVRRALAHGVDKQEINDTLYAGGNPLADSMISPDSEFGAAVERAIVKYPYDVRRSAQLMNDAGFVKAADGAYGHTREGRLDFALNATAGSSFETEMSIMASAWRSAGFPVRESVIPAAQSRDAELASSFPTMSTRSTAMGQPALLGLTTPNIPRAENRWRGSNRGGWTNPEYDRLAEAFTSTLEDEARARQVAQMARIYSEELPAISLYFPSMPFAHSDALKGPRPVPAESNMMWNIEQWTFE